MAPLNDTQQQLLAILGIVSATISLMGSSILIRKALMAQRRQNVTYHRLLIGLSVMDIFHDIAWGLQPFLIPASDDRVWSYGSTGTCSAVGFFVQLGSSVVLYNGALAMYFLVTIVFGVSDKKVVQYEPWLHVVPLGYALITATVGVSIGLYSSLLLGSFCWIGEYPKGCEDDEETECISTIIGWIFGGVPVIGTSMFLVVANTVIYSKVRRTTRQTTRFATRGHRADKQVAVQSILYVVACVSTLIWAMMVRTLESMGFHRESESDFLVLLFLAQLFYPLQGFWNCLIYVRPRYLRWRRRAPEQSRWWCFKKAIQLEAVMKGSKMSGTSLPSSAESQCDDGGENKKTVTPGDGGNENRSSHVEGASSILAISRP